MYSEDEDKDLFFYVQEAIEEELFCYYLNKIKEENYPEGLPKDTRLSGRFVKSIGCRWDINWKVYKYIEKEGKEIMTNSGSTQINLLQGLKEIFDMYFK